MKFWVTAIPLLLSLGASVLVAACGSESKTPTATQNPAATPNPTATLQAESPGAIETEEPGGQQVLTAAQQLVNDGVKQHLSGNYSAAISLYNVALRLDGNREKAYLNRGFAYVRLGELERGIEDYDKAIALKPQWATPYANKADALVDLNLPQHALESANQAIRLDANLLHAYANRARAYTLLRRDADAAKDVTKAIQLGYSKSKLETEITRLKSIRVGATATPRR